MILNKWLLNDPPSSPINIIYHFFSEAIIFHYFIFRYIFSSILEKNYKVIIHAYLNRSSRYVIILSRHELSLFTIFDGKICQTVS